jgi:hypothetical protein
MALGDEPGAALLLGKRPGQETTALELEADRAPLEVRQGDGEPFNQVDFAIRAAGHWYIATPQAYGELPASVVWRVDGSTAREFARIPRGALDPHIPFSGVRLARRSDGHAIGLVVDGEPTPERGLPIRWVLPIDVESAAPGEPESLGAADLGDRPAVPLCAEEDAGWILDTAWSATARVGLRVGNAERPTSGWLRNLYARERLTTERVCIERLSGTYEPASAESAPRVVRSVVPDGEPPASLQDGPVRETSVPISALQSRTRHTLRCHER